MGVVVFLFIAMGIFALGFLSTRAEKKRRESYAIPDKTPLLDYLGGLPSLEAGKVYAFRQDGHLALVRQRGGQRDLLSLSSIQGVNLNADVQTYNSGGGRSIGGAAVGFAVAGPLGAIVGSRKKTKTKTADHSTVSLRTTTADGIEIAVFFKGAQSVYNQLVKMLQA